MAPYRFANLPSLAFLEMAFFSCSEFSGKLADDACWKAVRVRWTERKKPSNQALRRRRCEGFLSYWA